jgi:uncharacterized protein YjbI with pentapeptide repeats
LWAVGMVIALVAIGLLVGKLYPSIWEALSRERVATLIGIVVALTVIIVLLALGGASLGWTGFGDKKLWEWLQLLSALAIPIVLAAAGFWFTAQQDARQQRIEDQRAQAERELAQQRAQDEALQAYLDQMSTLMLAKNLRNSEEGSEVRTLARARTLTVLRRLDGARRGSVVQFLAESDLISKDSSVLDLTGAYLDDLILNNANLSGANLSELDLNPPPFYNTARLKFTNLSDADLSGARLNGANLLGANLSKANLNGTHLDTAYLVHANLSGANLSGAYLPEAWLYDPNCEGCERTNLSGADLSNANLTGARVTDKQLEQAKSLEGATMPDGQKYEDWLKSKGRGEGGESSRPS